MSVRMERSATAIRVRQAGHTYAEIASRMGCSTSYAQDLVKDPDGSKGRARKDRYRGTCKDCGAPTDGSNGHSGTPERCYRCAPRAAAVFTRESIIDLIRAWADLYGAPPGARDWNPNQAVKHGRQDIADRFHADGCWPWSFTVLRRFGSWNAAIEAAGFTPRKSGGRGPAQPTAYPLVGGGQ